jgi:hypothetical protein
VLDHDGNEEQAAAGLPHDAIEHCGAGQTPIIGPGVARIVRACTGGPRGGRTEKKASASFLKKRSKKLLPI